MTGLEKLDNLINKTKFRALEFLNSLLRYLFEKVANTVKEKSPFLQRCIQFCPYLCNSLLAFASLANVELLVLEEHYSELVVEAIDTLVLFSAEREF